MCLCIRERDSEGCVCVYMILRACVFSVFLCGNDSVMSFPRHHQQYTTQHPPRHTTWNQNVKLITLVRLSAHYMFLFVPCLSSACFPICLISLVTPVLMKIPRYTVTLFGLPAVSGICCSNMRTGQRHTKKERHTHIFGCAHNNYHQKADKRSAGHVGPNLSDSCSRLKVRPILMECFGRGVSLVREPLDLHILPGTISLSLRIL